MTLTLDEFAKVLRAEDYLPNPSRLQLIDYLKGKPIDESNPYSLRAIADFLIGIDGYVVGAADLAQELAVLVRKAGLDPEEFRHKGGTKKMAKKRSKKTKEEEVVDDEEETDDEDVSDDDMPEDFEDEEEEDEDEEDGDDEEEEEEDEDEEEEEPVKPRRRAKKAAKPKKEKAPKRSKKGKAQKKRAKAGPRNAPISAEDRIPVLVEKMTKPGPGGEGWTINELYQAVTKTKAGITMFPARRSVKRVLAAYEGENFERLTATIWTGMSKKAKAPKKEKKEKAKKGAEKKKAKKNRK